MVSNSGIVTLLRAFNRDLTLLRAFNHDLTLLRAFNHDLTFDSRQEISYNHWVNPHITDLGFGWNAEGVTVFEFSRAHPLKCLLTFEEE